MNGNGGHHKPGAARLVRQENRAGREGRLQWIPAGRERVDGGGEPAQDGGPRARRYPLHGPVAHRRILLHTMGTNRIRELWRQRGGGQTYLVELEEDRVVAAEG